MMAKENSSVFFRKKPVSILIALMGNSSKEKYGSMLAKKVDCTYSHAVKILQGLEKLGIVGAEKKGRIKSVKLTKRGLDIAQHIEKVKELLG